MLFRERQEDAKRATQILVFLFLATLLSTAASVTYLIQFIWQHGMAFKPIPPHFKEWVFGFSVCLMLIGSAFTAYDLGDGGPQVARMLGGDEIRASNAKGYQTVLNIVAEMSLAATMRPPRVFVIDDEAINACAAGWTERDSVICVTTGAIRKLTRDELQGVIAHEMSHILNNDCALNMRMTYLVAGLQFIYNAGWMLIDLTWNSGGRSHRSRSSDAEKSSGIFIVSLIGFALVISGFIGWVGGRLLQSAISRQREYLADASAVQFTRLADGIGGALRKISHQSKGQDYGMRVKESTGNLVNHMMLSKLSFKSSDWMSTHPALDTRIERIFGRVLGDLNSEVDTKTNYDEIIEKQPAKEYETIEYPFASK